MHKFKSLGINNELGLKQICKQFAKILQTLYTFRRKHIGKYKRNRKNTHLEQLWFAREIMHNQTQ